MSAITHFDSDADKVRLLISDIDLDNPIFNHAAIEAFLSLSNNNIKRAAATALLTMAVNETLVQKRIRLLDLSTDGPAEAEALRQLAAQYRAEGDMEAQGNIGWLALPDDIGQFDKRENATWAKLEDRDSWA
jgi:hypothetical protein